MTDPFNTNRIGICLLAAFCLLLTSASYAQQGNVPVPHVVVAGDRPAASQAAAVAEQDHPVPAVSRQKAYMEFPKDNLPAPLAPPANDDCANAITLTPGATCSPVAASSNTATQSIAAINCAGFIGSANDDVWFKFTPTSTSYRIEVQGAANMDAVVDLRVGPACNGTNVACADATFGGGLEVINYGSFTPGTTYFIRVYDYPAGVTGWGDFTICIKDLQPPLNDDCGNGLNPPHVLSPNTSCTPGTVGLSSVQPGETFSCVTPTPTGSVWYSFIATQNDMWVSIAPDPAGGPACNPNFSITVFRYSGVCPPVAVGGCKNYQTYSTQYIYNNLEMTGLSPGTTYLIQVTQHSGCASFGYFDFCIRVGTYLNCATCSAPCGPMCTFAGYSPPGPMPGTVVSSCPGFPLSPPMNQFDTETNCYTFTAPNDTIWIQQVVWAWCFPQTYTFNYNLYTSGCGLIQGGSVFANNMITGLVPGTVYRMCYTLQASCSWDSLIYPYLYTTATVLPVELQSFEALSHPDRITVSWITASEINNREFILERSGPDWTFKEIARLPGAGQSTSLIRYEITDRDPLDGLNYYRLKQIDFNGDEHFSQPVAARFSKAGPAMVVTPNPAKDQCLVRYYAVKNSKAFLKVTDMKGKVAWSRQLDHAGTGYHDYPLDLSGIGQGLYFLHLTGDDTTFSTKLMKQ